LKFWLQCVSTVNNKEKNFSYQCSGFSFHPKDAVTSLVIQGGVQGRVFPFNASKLGITTLSSYFNSSSKVPGYNYSHLSYKKQRYNVIFRKMGPIKETSPVNRTFPFHSQF
jgi:hypothetical protein